MRIKNNIKIVILGALIVVPLLSAIIFIENKSRFDCNITNEKIKYQGSDGSLFVVKEYRARGGAENFFYNERDEEIGSVYITLIASRETYSIENLISIDGNPFKYRTKFKSTICTKKLYKISKGIDIDFKITCEDDITQYRHEMLWSKEKGIYEISTKYKDGFIVTYKLLSKVGIASHC